MLNLCNENRLKKLLKKPNLLLIDIRSPVEFRNGTIENAQNLPAIKFISQMIGLSKIDKTIVVFGSENDLEDIKLSARYADELGLVASFTTYESLEKIKEA